MPHHPFAPALSHPVRRLPALPGALQAQPEGSLSFPRVFAAVAEMSAGLNLFTGAGRVASLALPFCALLAARGESVMVLDAANCLNLYRLTEWARRRRLSPRALLARLRIARAFTPFQLASILANIGVEMERSRARRVILTGLPDCLYDEELSEQEARNTFARCRASLAQLAQKATVLAFSELPPHPVRERRVLLDALGAHARRIFEVQLIEPLYFVPVKGPGLLTVRTERSSEHPERLKAEQPGLTVIEQARERPGHERGERRANERRKSQRGQIVPARGNQSGDAADEDAHGGKMREAAQGVREDEQRAGRDGLGGSHRV